MLWLSAFKYPVAVIVLSFIICSTDGRWPLECFYNFSVAKNNWLACFHFVFLPLFSRRVNNIKKTTWIALYCLSSSLYLLLPGLWIPRSVLQASPSTGPAVSLYQVNNTVFYYKSMFIHWAHRASGSSERLASNKFAKLALYKSARLLLNKLMKFVPTQNLRLPNPWV